MGGGYFLFRPYPSKRGYRLWGDTYYVAPAALGWAEHTTALGVSFRVEGENLRVRSLATGPDYAWTEGNSRDFEAVRADAQISLAKADAAAEAHRQAEQHNAELVALLGRRS